MTPRTSVRAAARRLYEEMRGRWFEPQFKAPYPDPSPTTRFARGGGERKEQGEGERDVRVAGVEPNPPSLRFGGQDLMAHVRRMYEGLDHPGARHRAARRRDRAHALQVRAKNNWKPRYAWTPDGVASARAAGAAALERST